MKIKENNLWIYFVLIPFLIPRGFFEYSDIYKKFFTLWLYISLLVGICCSLDIWSLWGEKIKQRNFIWAMLGYHFFLFIDTLLVQHRISEGFQKIFAAPVLCIIIAYFIEKNPNGTIICLANILTVAFLLNVTVFSPLIWKNYFSYEKKLLFLGHIQIASQLGILGLILSYLLKKISGKFRFRANCLVVLSVLTMIMSITSAAMIALAFIILGYLISINVRERQLLELDYRFYAFFVSIFDFVFMLYLSLHDWNLSQFRIYTTLNGRFTIWRRICEMLRNHWLLGYGVYGAKIKVYWSTWSSKTDGMTYAHNQFYQVLLDGGVILLILFLLMFFCYLSHSNEIKDMQTKRVVAICMIATFAVMLTESLTEYYYIFIIWSLVAYMPYMISKFKKDVKNCTL